MAPRLPKLRRGDPKAKVTGTGYSSTGRPDIQLGAADYNEVGSAARSTLFETIPELSSPFQAQQQYTKMWRNSVSVRIGIRAAEAPVVGGDYYMEPFSADPIDVTINEFIKFCLFDAPTVPFKRTIRQICNSQYRTGTRVMEKVFALQEWAPSKSTPGANRKQYTVLKKLAPRATDTINEIQYDPNGGPLGITQSAINPQNGSSAIVTIPIDKLAIFPFEEDDGNLLGNSILRPAFVHYTYLDPLYKIDGIQKERHAVGVPDVKLHAGYTDADNKLAHVIGRNLRANERAYVVSNDRFDVSFLELNTQPIDVLKSAEFHDTMILKTIMLQFLQIGADVGGGGKATASTSADMFMKSMRYVGESICDGFNNYIIPQLVAYNFNTDNFPRLKVRNIGEVKDLQMWASAMANLVGKGAIEVDEDTENFIRAQVDFPKRTTPRPAVVTTNVEDIYNENPDGTSGTGPTKPAANGTQSKAGLPGDRSTGTGHPNGTGYVGKPPQGAV